MQEAGKIAKTYGFGGTLWCKLKTGNWKRNYLHLTFDSVDVLKREKVGKMRTSFEFAKIVTIEDISKKILVGVVAAVVVVVVTAAAAGAAAAVVVTQLNLVFH
eukprot:TRINITY_DN13991_c0_g1_i2.p3 TRINITY_DN13991_c0_g1~~TRINITY_DN13991_c0_g1_i2.p3  ORF type:complete len:103 (-),score=35.52 TRINITY_DN13991_c0_g1_i2:360-668(-)